MTIIGAPRRPEINQYAIKFLIGAIAMLLPVLEMFVTAGQIRSISESFWAPHEFWIAHTLWSRNIFVGLLFAIAALLLTYNGRDENEMWLTKLAALAAFLIAMFPCGCFCDDEEIVPHVHALSAAAMFAVLAIFCNIFRRRALEKGHREARRRAFVYTACGIAMLVSIVLFIPGVWADEKRLLYAEWLGLWAFGISWLTASHAAHIFVQPHEREPLFRDRTSAENADAR